MGRGFGVGGWLTGAHGRPGGLGFGLTLTLALTLALTLTLTLTLTQVRYTGLAGFVGGLFPAVSGLTPSPAQSVENQPPPDFADLLAVMKTSMGEPLLHWSANLVRNTSYRIAQARP